MSEYVATAFSPQQIESEIADPRNVFFVAEESDGLAGFAKLRDGAVPSCVQGQSAIEVERMYVGKEWFGTGVAVRLMDVVLDEAAGMNRQSVWLGVWEHNLRAKAFYGKYGFHVVGAKDFLVGTDRQTDLVMERPNSNSP